MAEERTEPDVRRPRSQRGDDGIRPLTRAVSILVLPFLAAASVLLYLFAGDTDRLFAWTIQPPLTAMVLASAYLGGIWFFVQVLRQGHWHRVRHGFPAVLIFATLLAIATILHWDRFHFGHVSFVAWATLYFVTPVLLVAVLIVNWRADVGRADAVDTVTPWPARLVLAIVGVASAVVGILMFVLPTLAIGSWAWEVTPLTARVLGAVLILPGTVNVWMLLDGRWSAFKWIVQAELVCMVFLNIAIVLCRDQLDWRNAVTIPVVVVLAASLLFFAWLYVDGERRARRVRLSGTT